MLLGQSGNKFILDLSKIFFFYSSQTIQVALCSKKTVLTRLQVAGLMLLQRMQDRMLTPSYRANNLGYRNIVLRRKFKLVKQSCCIGVQLINGGMNEFPGKYSIPLHVVLFLQLLYKTQIQLQSIFGFSVVQEIREQTERSLSKIISLACFSFEELSSRAFQCLKRTIQHHHCLLLCC